jgi:hypothetical protein
MPNKKIVVDSCINCPYVALNLDGSDRCSKNEFIGVPHLEGFVGRDCPLDDDLKEYKVLMTDLDISRRLLHAFEERVEEQNIEIEKLRKEVKEWKSTQIHC